MKIETRHLSDPIRKRVEAWYKSPSAIACLDGSRSIILPHPEKSGFVLKIKGAGLNGGPIRFGKKLQKGPEAQVFDFDGRRMVDIASGHDNADLGAASFQQASVEYHLSARIAALGYNPVPCQGYGRITNGEHVTWFSVFELDKSWRGEGDYRLLNIESARLLLELAVSHYLVGHFWFMEAQDGRLILKDLHAFHEVSPINGSQLTWTLQVIDALYIRCQACRHFGRKVLTETDPDVLAALPLWSLIHEPRPQDYNDLKSKIVKPYIRGCPENFSSAKLYDSLRSTRVGSALLDICPDAFARWH